MSKEYLSVRLDPELKAALAALAERERRSITGQIEAMIVERAKAAGVLPKSWSPKGGHSATD